MGYYPAKICALLNIVILVGKNRPQTWDPII